jgi:hypothetical protein
MQFIEMSGKMLKQVLNDDEMDPEKLAQIGLTDESVVRINRQGDIEIRRAEHWDLIGGLLGEFDERIRQATGMDWA